MDFEQIANSLPRVILPKGKLLVRCRVNKDNRLFFRKTDLYDPHGNYPSLGRANDSGQVIFYASYSDGTEESPAPRITNIYEVSDFSTDKTKSGKQIVTYSGWVSTDDLVLVCFPSSTVFQFQTETLKVVNDIWIKNQGSLDKDLVDEIENLSSKFASDDPGDGSLYHLTLAFANYVYKNCPDVDGILYPSVKMEGKGINIALRTDVPEKKLHLKQVTVCHLYKLLDKSILLNRYECKVINPNHFSYKNHKTYDKRAYNKVIKDYEVKE